MHDQSEPPGSPWRAALCAALFVAGGAYHLRALRYENEALRRAQAGKTAELALLRASDDRRFESYRAHVDALRTRHPRRRGNATAEHVPVGILVRTFAGDLQWLAYCLRSVAKFAQPYVDSVTVVFPEADDATVGAFVRLAHPWARTNVSTSAAVFAAAMRAAHPHKFARCHAGQCLPDYAAQIFDKLCADLYVPAARFILHIDSDTVLTRPLAFADVEASLVARRLTDVPSDVLLLVLGRLGAADLCAVAATCGELWHLVSHASLLWEPAFKKKHGAATWEAARQEAEAQDAPTLRDLYLRELRRKLIKCAAKKQGELASKGFPARSRLGFRLVGVQTSK